MINIWSADTETTHTAWKPDQNLHKQSQESLRKSEAGWNVPSRTVCWGHVSDAGSGMQAECIPGPAPATRQTRPTTWHPLHLNLRQYICGKGRTLGGSIHSRQSLGGRHARCCPRIMPSCSHVTYVRNRACCGCVCLLGRHRGLGLQETHKRKFRGSSNPTFRFVKILGLTSASVGFG
jgi:hypothetical protein